MDIDRRLHEAGQRWRESQGPALQPLSAASLEEAARPQVWRKGLAPMAAAAAVVVIILGFVSLRGATTGAQQLPAGSVTTPSPSVSSPSTEPSTSAARAEAAAAAAAMAARAAAAKAEAERRLSNSATVPPAAACVASQLRPSLGTTGPAMGTLNTQILLQNVSGQPCYLRGVFPLRGVAASGTTTRLIFPGDSATSYPSPVVPGNVEPGASGAFWLATELNGCQRGTRFAKLVIELSPKEHVQMPWLSGLTSGCLYTESAAGPFPQPIPSIP